MAGHHESVDNLIVKLRRGERGCPPDERIICKFIKVFYYALACWTRMSSATITNLRISCIAQSATPA